VSGPGQRSFPMLSVESLGASLSFYEGLLGGERAYQFPPEGPPVFVTVRFGPSEVGLGQLGAGPALHGRALRPATGHRMELCVYVHDARRRLGAGCSPADTATVGRARGLRQRS
jgi:lactoylglutathione lyase